MGQLLVFRKLRNRWVEKIGADAESLGERAAFKLMSRLIELSRLEDC
jgi:hypothetical protein